jgi:hypothetical protein
MVIFHGKLANDQRVNPMVHPTSLRSSPTSPIEKIATFGTVQAMVMPQASKTLR